MSETAQYPYGTYPFELFNPVQSEVLQYLESDSNIIVASPTASGKTICGEILGGRELANGKKLIYTSPLKALVEEKVADWTNESHPWFRYRKFVMTGDYRMSDDREDQLKEAEIIISTYEMISVRCRRASVEKSSWMEDVGALIVDEAHFISSEGRGDHLENAIIGFSRVCPFARIIFLSATMRNAEQLGDWLGSLNQKPTDIVRSDYRPCELTIHYVPFEVPERTRIYERYEVKENLKVNTVIDLIDQFSQDQWLLFVHAKSTGKRLLQAISKTKYRDLVSYHNADLDLQRRKAVEENFRSGVTRFLIATSTLAYGMNLPARRVAVLGTERGTMQVDPLDIIQECGRAGRPKYDKTGDAYLIVEQSELLNWKMLLTVGVDVRSQLQEKIGFHLIGEIAEKRVKTFEDAAEWADKTLCHAQGLWDDAHVEMMVDAFERERLIRKVPLDWSENSGTIYEATQLGFIASMNYFDPFDVSSWKKNLYVLRERELARDDAAIAWMWASINSNIGGYIPKELQLLTNEYLHELRGKNLRVPGKQALAIATVLWNHLQGRDDKIKPFVSIRVPLISDAERVITCLEQVDTRVLRNKEAKYWELLLNRVFHGVSWRAAELCRVPGIGKRYAESLMYGGVDSIKEMVEQRQAMREILPAHVFDKAYEAARRIVANDDNEVSSGRFS